MVTATRGLACVLAASVLGACGGDNATQSDAGAVCAYDCAPCLEPPCEDTVGVFQYSINRDVDILFVIDNSWSMAEKQLSLVNNFYYFVDLLEDSQGGLPNLHLGVISTDVGAGPYGVPGCSGYGDFGTLQNAPRYPGCTPPDGWFIRDVMGDEGRERNYTGSLAEAFACIAKLGTDGCRFSQPLESARLALDGSNPVNEGFLRDDASLLLFFLTDKDDCSARDTAVFDTPSVAVEEAPFLCFEHGVLCDPDAPSTPGTKTGCTPRGDSEYLYGVQEYVDFFKGLEDDPTWVFVSGVMGNPTPVTVSEADGGVALEPSCSSALGDAFPGIRLSAFLDSFPMRNTQTTICNENLSDGLISTAFLLARAMGDICVEGAITNAEECTTYQVRKLGVDVEQISEIELCASTNPPDPLPCYTLVEDPGACPNTPSHLRYFVEWGGQTVPPTTYIVLRCPVDDVPESTSALPTESGPSYGLVNGS